MAQLIKNFIDKEQSPLADILNKVSQLNALNEKIVKHLRPELIPHCHVASFQQGVLRIVTDSAAFATELRYDIPMLLEQFKLDQELPEIFAMDCYVDTGWRLPFLSPHAIIEKNCLDGEVDDIAKI